MIDTLKQLGLSEIEAKVYSSIINHGPCFAGLIVKTVKKHRQIIYNALESLEDKKLIEVGMRNGKNLYSVGDPHRLIIEAKQKEILAKEIGDIIEKKLSSDREHVTVFKGGDSYEKGIQDFRNRAFEAGEYLVIRGETEGWFELTRPFFARHVEELKKMKNVGIPVMIVFFQHERKRAENFIGPHFKNPYTCKIVPDEYKLPHSAWIAGEFIYFVTPAADPLIIQIRSKILAEKYHDYFWHIWKKGELLYSK